MTNHRKKRGRMVFFLITIILAIYLVNMALGFIEMPSFVEKIEKYILFIAGVLLFFGGFNFLKVKKHNL